MEIRPAEIDELPLIQELNSKLFEHDRDRDPNMNVEWPFQAEGEAYFRKIITDEASVCLVADEGGQIVGYLAGRVMVEPYRVTKRTEVENMFVESDARGAGTGKALMSAFFDWSRSKDADESYVVGYYGNDNAIAFYEAMGFARYSLALNAKL